MYDLIPLGLSHKLTMHGLLKVTFHFNRGILENKVLNQDVFYITRFKTLDLAGGEYVGHFAFPLGVPQILSSD